MKWHQEKALVRMTALHIRIKLLKAHPEVLHESCDILVPFHVAQILRLEHTHHVQIHLGRNQQELSR